MAFVDKLKSVVLSGKEVLPIVEGGKGIGATSGVTCGAFAAAGAVGTFSGVNADSYDDKGNRLKAPTVVNTFKNGKPAGEPEEFLSGWMMGKDKPDVWGRPVAVLEMPDGSLLVSEDGNNRIYRISYQG